MTWTQHNPNSINIRANNTTLSVIFYRGDEGGEVESQVMILKITGFFFYLVDQLRSKQQQ